MLSFVGGEPLYEKKNFEMLKYMIDIGNTDVFVSMVTNGSVNLSQHQTEILSQFKNINFCVSIDGVGPVFEYLRYPLKWDILNKNLLLFRKISNNVSASYTISNLNILYHTQTIKWFNDNDIPHSNNPVYDPEWLRTRSFPESIKQKLKDILNETDYSTYIGYDHNENDDKKFAEFLVQIKKQDTMKKISLENYLPDLHNLITQI
jgi:MoaA/NifB/PqqE/SkfB family radical SAM enzyme